jgi:flagellin-like protein
MFNRRGLSQVITTVLLILIVLAAIIIIWAFISPVITSTGEGVGADCVTLQLQVTQCDTSSATGGKVKRNIGKGDLREVQILNDVGAPIPATTSNPPWDELETGTFDPTSPVPLSPGDEVQAFAIVGDDQRLCAPTAAPFVCT